MTNQKMYKWKRFWIKREGNIDLSDEGFLYNPESEYGDIINPDAVSFESIKNIRSLILLGEPGIGKSYSIKEAYKNSSGKVDDKSQFLDLRSFGSEDRLLARLFKNDIFT